MMEYTYTQLVEKTKQLYNARADISDEVYLELNHYIGMYIVRYTIKMREAGSIEQKPMTKALRHLRMARASINKLRDYTIHSSGIPIKKKQNKKSRVVLIIKDDEPKSEYSTPHPTRDTKTGKIRKPTTKQLDARLKKSKITVKKAVKTSNMFDIKDKKSMMSMEERLVYAKKRIIPERFL